MSTLLATAGEIRPNISETELQSSLNRSSLYGDGEGDESPFVKLLGITNTGQFNYIPGTLYIYQPNVVFLCRKSLSATEGF